jgi:hypothetical protein
VPLPGINACRNIYRNIYRTACLASLDFATFRHGYKLIIHWSTFIFSTHIGVPFMFFDCANLMESVPG